MAFKMNRPGKMHGPRKSTMNKYGRKAKPAMEMEEGSGLYYNSSMGPMKMHSPSALKQMEEEAGMEEMMGMMGDMGGEAPAGPVEEAPVEKESSDGYEENKQDFISESNTYRLDDEYGVEGVPDGAVIKDPDGIVGEQYERGNPDADYTYTVKGNVVTITGVKEPEDLLPGEESEPVIFGQELVPVETPEKPKEGDLEKYSDLEKYDDDK